MRLSIGPRIAAAGLGLGLVLVVGAGSSPATAGDFGEHVSTCARTMGFDADHNPGMHQGFDGWDPDHVC